MTEYNRELDRISCFLSGEIEVPDNVPGWRVLCHSSIGPSVSRVNSRIRQSTTTNILESSAARNPPYRTMKRKRLEMDDRSTSDIHVPPIWDTCLLILWEHTISRSLSSRTMCKEVFVERIRRISSLAIQSINQRGFFTIKHLLGISRASRIHEWALNKWVKRPDLFRPGKLSVTETDSSKTVRTDMVAWFCTEKLANLESIEDGVYEVKLLFLYLDAIVRAIAPNLITRSGLPAKIDSRSWAALSVYKRHPADVEKPIGYRAHYDNPVDLSDGRLLSIMYYLNPQWAPTWGGNLILWPQETSTSAAHPEGGISESSIQGRTSHTLSIPPTLDRLVLFYADERTLHLVQPVLPSSMVAERIAIASWYFDAAERRNYLDRQKEYCSC